MPFTVDGYLNDEKLPVDPNDPGIVVLEWSDGGKTVEFSGASDIAPTSTVEFDIREINIGFFGLPNVLSFTPTNFVNVAVGQEFSLGTLEFTNGEWFGFPDSGVASFGFEIVTSPYPNGNTDIFDQVFKGALEMITNPNTGTPEENADFLRITDENGVVLANSNSMRVFDEGDGVNTGSAEIIGMFGSLNLVGFDNSSGGAFLDPSTDRPLATVPEPSTIALIGLGLVGLGFARKKKQS